MPPLYLNFRSLKGGMVWFYLKHFYLNYQLNNWKNFTSNILQIIWYITFSNVWLDKNNVRLTSFSFDLIRILWFMAIVSVKMRNGAKFRSFSYLGVHHYRHPLYGLPPFLFILSHPFLLRLFQQKILWNYKIRISGKKNTNIEILLYKTLVLTFIQRSLNTWKLIMKSWHWTYAENVFWYIMSLTMKDNTVKYKFSMSFYQHNPSKCKK